MTKLTIELDEGDGQDYTFLGWKEDGLAFYATSHKRRPVMVEPVSAYPDDRYTGEPYRFPRFIPQAISPKRFKFAWTSRHREVLGCWRAAKLAEVEAMTMEEIFPRDAVKGVFGMPRPVRTPAAVEGRRREEREKVERHYDMLAKTSLHDLFDSVLYPNALDEFRSGKWLGEMGDDFGSMLSQAVLFDAQWHMAHEAPSEYNNSQQMACDRDAVNFVMPGDDGEKYYLRRVVMRPPTDREAEAYAVLAEIWEEGHNVTQTENQPSKGAADEGPKVVGDSDNTHLAMLAEAQTMLSGGILLSGRHTLVEKMAPKERLLFNYLVTPNAQRSGWAISYREIGKRMGGVSAAEIQRRRKALEARHGREITRIIAEARFKHDKGVNPDQCGSGGKVKTQNRESKDDPSD
jgi:hypothetical protein